MDTWYYKKTYILVFLRGGIALDIFTHALLGAAIAPQSDWAWPMAVSSVVPDLWTIPPLVEYLVTHRGHYRNQEFWKSIPDRYTQLTRWSHSVVPLAAVFLVGAIGLKISPWLFLPWLLHLVIDIPTHARSRTGYPFYPWSRWQPLGARNWYDMWWFSVLTIVGLAAVVLTRFA